MIKKIFQKNKKGFTLLFAVLISVIILAVGASIISIALRQVVISSIGRESQYAFYAANTGVECAMYWDLNYNVFAETDTTLGADSLVMSCAGVSGLGSTIITAEQTDSNGINFIVNSFSIEMADEDRCVDVKVIKEIDYSGADPVVSETVIESRGYNTCNESNPKRTERGLRINY